MARRPGHRRAAHRRRQDLRHPAQYGADRPRRRAAAADAEAPQAAQYGGPIFQIPRGGRSRALHRHPALGNRERRDGGVQGDQAGRRADHRAGASASESRRHGPVRARVRARRSRAAGAAHARPDLGLRPPLLSDHAGRRRSRRAARGGRPAACHRAAPSRDRARLQALSQEHALAARAQTHEPAPDRKSGRLRRAAPRPQARGRGPAHRPAHRRDAVFPRPAGVGGAREARHRTPRRGGCRGRGPAGMDLGLRDGRGSLLARDAVLRGDRRCGQTLPPADLRHRRGGGGARGGARGPISAVHRERCPGRAPAPVLRKGRRSLSRDQGAARGRRVRRAERARAAALLEARPRHLPQPPDLSRAGRSAAGNGRVSVRPQGRRASVPRLVRDGRRGQGFLRTGIEKVPHLQAHGGALRAAVRAYRRGRPQCSRDARARVVGPRPSGRPRPRHRCQGPASAAQGARPRDRGRQRAGPSRVPARRRRSVSAARRGRGPARLSGDHEPRAGRAAHEAALRAAARARGRRRRQGREQGVARRPLWPLRGHAAPARRRHRGRCHAADQLRPARRAPSLGRSRRSAPAR